MTSKGFGPIAFRVAVSAYTAGLLVWLLVGLLPVFVLDVPGVAARVEQLAAGTGPLAAPAMLLLHPAQPMTGLSGNTLLQYAFSLLNLVLGVLLIVRRPDGLVPRLLALGLLGTAATFNLPSHEAFHVLGSPWPIALIHFTFHIVSGVAYLWAVALFPDGRLPERVAISGRSLGVVAAVITAVVALICWWSDFLAHPQFFVVFFGILIPVVGVGAQALRLTDGSTTPTTKRSARLLIAALLPALVLAVIWFLARGLALFDVASGAADATADRLQDLFPAVFAIVPVVLFAGVLRYRLFDIDRLLSRVLVYLVIVVGSGLVYLVAVVTGGALVGGASWWTVTVLAVAAVALERAWALAQRWANRIVFGQDLGPAAAMRTLISGLEQATPTAELEQLVQVSVRATRADRAELWTVDGADWSLRAAAPMADPGRTEPRLGAGRNWPVTHQGRRLGVLTVDLAPAEELPAGEQALLTDLAAHAGLLVHNAVLADQLEQHVMELTKRAGQLAASRRRMVAAQDRERHRLERNLHDGAQQTLVAVMLGLRMAAADGTPTGTRSSMLGQLARELEASRGELAEISGGQLPAALRELGLRGGLEGAAAIARRTGLTVDVAVDPDGLTPRMDDALASVYYCCSEALQNAVKHAHASLVRIEVGVDGPDVVFSVTDDGAGIGSAPASDGNGGIQGLDDRASAAGGWIMVESAPGRGTRVHGAIPVHAGAKPEPALAAPAGVPVAAGRGGGYLQGTRYE